MVSRILNSFRRSNMKEWLESLSESENLYFFIGKSSPWNDDNLPPTPTDTFVDYQEHHKDMLALKKINTVDFVPSTRNIPWEIGTVYDEYDSNDVNLFTTSKFYVVTADYAVYKCLDNNNGVQSTVEPSGTGTTNITTGDGYVWKYLYTVSPADVAKFVTPNWIPAYSNSTVQAAATDGTVDKINIISGGSGYTTATVNIFSNTGSGATATATISSGVITNITITDPGTGYKDISITITGNGTGAVLQGVLPPFGGHGSNIEYELGVKNLLLSVNIVGTETNTFPVDISYRKFGIIVNPLLESDGSAAAASVYSASDIKKGTGEFYYISYTTPIPRSSDDSKNYSFTIAF